MLPEEITAIKPNATSQNIAQPQVPYSNQYGYEIVEGSSSLHYPSGGPSSNSSSGCQERSGDGELVCRVGPVSDGNQRMNITAPIDIAVPALYTPVLSEGSSSISGDDDGQNDGSGTPSRRRDRISEYEAYCKNTPAKVVKGKSKGNDSGLALGGGAEVVRFHVKKTVWGDRVGSPISRFPNEVLTHTFSFLDPASLSALSLVSKRFHTLISSPHAWRSAFARYFPEQAHLSDQQKLPRLPPPSPNPTPLRSHDEETRASYSSDKRYFTCLVSESSWRKEYLLRTSLLRSLSRGKAHVPQYTPPRHPESRNSTNAGSIITYPGCTGGHSVTHISATFPSIDRGPKNTVNGNTNGSARGQGSASSRPHVIHASCETGFVASSDPTTGRIDRQPLVDGALPFQRPSPDWPIPGFSEHRPGIQLGSSLMDLSDELGWCWGETVPGGRVYVEPKFLATNPLKGLCLPQPDWIHPVEIDAYISSLWIAKKKSKGIFEATNSSCGLLVGQSVGRLTMYSLPNSVKERDNPRLWINNHISWLVCPGVPIVDIKVDEDYSIKRMRKHKRRKEGMVFVIVNALGEVWYLRDLVGPWRIVEQTRRTVRFMDDDDRKEAETPEKNLALHWEKVRSFWNGWGLDYFLEVDFAGGNVVVGKKGKKYTDPVTGEVDRFDESEGEEGGWIKCFTLGTKTKVDMEKFSGSTVMDRVYPSFTTAYTSPWDGKSSIFGGYKESETTNTNAWKEKTYESEELDDDVSETPTECIPDEDLWTERLFSFSDEKNTQKSIEITAVAIDKSSLAVVAPDEDDHPRNKSNDVPGLNARLFTVGTATGSVFVWNLRSPLYYNGMDQPLRIIHTESPMITTLGLTSLYLLHGGSDGLVQCWDPLASTLEPIRTIHSRFSSRARRRMAQAEQNNQNLAIGDNQYAARAVQLDPDSTVLRGIIALGTYIRYWSFAGDVSSAINGKRKKKLARRAGVGGGLASPPGRGRIVQGWKGDINGELAELEREKEKKRREEEKLREKFGVPGFGFGELSEEEMVMYARMLSEETFEKEKEKEKNGLGVAEGSSSNLKGGFSGEPIATSDEDEEAALAAAIAASEAEALARTASASGSQFAPSASSSTSAFDSGDGDSTGQGDEADADLAEAIRLSLLNSTPGAGVSFRYSYDDEGDDYKPGGGGSGASTSTAAPFHSREEYGFGNSHVSSSAREAQFNYHPISTSTTADGAWITATSKQSQKQKKLKNNNTREKDSKEYYINEWPSPRHAAIVSPGGKLDEVDLGGGDDDLEFAIRLSLAEEESRRLAGSGGGGAANDNDKEEDGNGKGKGKTKRNGKGKGREKV